MGAMHHLPLRGARHPVESLTGRELEILELVGTGLSMKSVARALGISPGTAGWHLKNSYQKLGVSSREEALLKARAENLIESRMVCPVCSCHLAARN